MVIHKEKGSDYGVSVPDLPGRFSAGRTMQEALEAAREAVAAHIEGMLLDADRVPPPTSIDAHQRTRTTREACGPSCPRSSEIAGVLRNVPVQRL